MLFNCNEQNNIERYQYLTYKQDNFFLKYNFQMHYLEATISENLRMFPPATESDRNCTQDCTGGKKMIFHALLIIIFIFFAFFITIWRKIKICQRLDRGFK